MNIILVLVFLRRKEILENMNVRFDIIKNEIDEIILEGEILKYLVMRLVFEKSMFVVFEYNEDVVIGVDIVVVLDNVILGKLKDEFCVRDMLKRLFGREY